MKSSQTRSGIHVILVISISAIIGFILGWGGAEIARRIKSPADGEYIVSICATTDVHGSYFDKDFDGTPAKSSLANISSCLKELRGNGADPVLIDCGDNLQGSNAAYFYNYVKIGCRHIFTQMQQYLGYDALVVGNHDIETGHPVYDRLRTEAGIPMLAANAVASKNGNRGKAYFDEYTIIKKGKIRIAVIGMTNANIKSWLPETLWKGLDFIQITSMAQEVIDRVKRKENPHITILAIHSGRGADGYHLENEAFQLASTIHGVDMILCGHDHQGDIKVVRNPEGDVLLVDSGCKAEFLSKTDLKVVFKKGKAVSVTPADVQLMRMADYSPDPEFIRQFAPEYDTICNFANRAVCEVKGDIAFNVPSDGPNEYLTLIHRAQLDASGADISFAAPLSNNGGINAGSISWNDLTRIYRYENTLAKTELTGRQIKDYLEYSYDCHINGSAPDYNFDTAEGIIYTVDFSKEKGGRIAISGMCDGRPFCEDGIYTVAMTSYRISGGGNLLKDGAGANPEEMKILEDYKDIRSIICDYMKKSPEGYVPQCSCNWSVKK